MLRKLFITLMITLATRTAMAVTIDLPGYDFADIVRTATVTPSSKTAYTSNYLSAVNDITDGYATTYIFTSSPDGRVDLKFGTDVYAASGFDLSIFFVGGGPQGHTFGLSLPDHQHTFADVINFDSRNYAHYVHTGFNLSDNDASNSSPIYRMDIDLDPYGFSGENPIGTVRLVIGNQSAVPSLVGAYHLQPAAVVPIPLPIVLFGSGLALLGLVGRRNTH